MNPQWAGLVNSIVQHPQSHQVDRKVKMDATVEVMNQNLERRHSNSGKVRVLSETETNKGYGTGSGRGTGD